MLGAILSAGAGLLGNLFGAKQSSDNADKTNAHNARIAAEQNALARENMAQQREFAQHGVRWKVADAEAAGLHPLAALGAQTSSFSNVVGASPYELKTGGADYGAMGQNISRAIDAGSTAQERQDRMGAAIARTAQVFSLEKLNLENEQLKTNIALQRAQLGPSFPPSALAHLSRSPSRTSEGHAIDDKKIEQQASDAPAYKVYKHPLGPTLYADPTRSDGDVVTSRLGESEPLELITAIANSLSDLKYTAQQKAGMGKERNPFRHYRKRNSFNDRFHY